jgi:hypothetical protein
MLQSAEQEQHEGVVYSRKVREGQRMGNDLEVNAREKKFPAGGLQIPSFAVLLGSLPRAPFRILKQAQQHLIE